MGAQVPKGKVPDKEDVKPTTTSSTEETAEVVKEDPGKETDPTKEPETALDEGDLKELGESRKIPYGRFKEVNDEKKSLELQIAQSKDEYDLKLNRAVRDAELRIKAELESQREDDDVYATAEPWEKDSSKLEKRLEEMTAKLSALETVTNRTNLETQMTQLKATYPEADELAVLGWSKSQPGAAIKDLMQLSHNQVIERAAVELAKMLNKKKEKAKIQVNLPSTSPGFRLSESERPKTLKEASDAMKKFLAERS